MKKYIPVLLWTVTFAVAAVKCYNEAIAGENFDFFFNGWWALFILVPSVADIVLRGVKASNLSGLLSGALLFISLQDYVEWKEFGKFVLPATVLIAGIGIIFSGLAPMSKGTEDEAAGKPVIAAFSSVTSVPESGARHTAVSIFGKCVLDLSRLSGDERISISACSVFGSVEIILPENTGAQAEGLLIVSGCDNRTFGCENVNAFVEHNLVFGNITVK